MKKLNYLTIAIALGAFAITSTSCNKNSWPYCTKANGNMTTETRTLDDFTEIEIEGSGDAFLHQLADKAAPSIEIEASDNIMDKIKTDVKGDKLIISTDCIRGDNDMNFVIKVADLSKVTISGSGSAQTMHQFDVDNLGLEINGSGDMDFDVLAADITCDISGSGDIDLDGTCDDLDIEINGSGDISAFDMKAANCFIDISGSGDCQVTTDGELNVRISGSGDVVYDGNPSTFSTDNSGSGTVSRR